MNWIRWMLHRWKIKHTYHHYRGVYFWHCPDCGALPNAGKNCRCK